MGFPVCYSELLLPKLLLYTLSIFTFLRRLIFLLFRLMGLSDFLEPELPWPENPNTSRIPEFHSSISTLLMKQLLPVVKFTELVDPPESCAVCLYEFESEDEIRWLTNCNHVFHRTCLDRWMGYDQKTCPLCRTLLVPDDVQDSINERLWAASGIPEFHEDYYQDNYGHIDSSL